MRFKIWKRITMLVTAALLLLGTEIGPVQAASYDDDYMLERKAPAAADAVSLSLNGKPLKQQGIQGEEDVLVPLDMIREELKLPVKYDRSKGVYTIKRGNVTVQLQPTNIGAKATVDGSTQILPYEWKEIDGKPYVSIKVLTDHLGYTLQPHEPSNTANLVSHKLNDIKITTQTITENIPEASIKVEYPQVSGLKNKAAQRKINSELKSKAEAFVAESVKEAKGNQPSPSGNKYEFIGNYTVTYNRDGILSILEQTYAYTGGAHGNSVREGLTYRLSDGKLLSLDELLRANPNYRTIVDPAIAKQLEQTEGYFGNFKTIGANPSYYVKDEGVYIFFQLYDYLPYVFGFPEYYFPFAKLLPQGADPFDFGH